MKKQLTLSVFLTILISLTASAVEWDLDVNNWAIAGPNCPSPAQISVAAVGNQLELTLDDSFTILLDDAADPNVSWKFCTLSMKADLQAGDYTPLLTQTINYSYEKTAGSHVNITAVGTFFGTPFNIAATHSFGSVTTGTDATVAGVTVGNSPTPNLGSCLGQEDLPGLYSITLATIAQRSSTADTAKIGLTQAAGSENYTAKVDIIAPVIVCPHQGGSL